MEIRLKVLALAALRMVVCAMGFLMLEVILKGIIPPVLVMRLSGMMSTVASRPHTIHQWT